MYSWIKMEKMRSTETIPGMEGGGLDENNEGVNSTMTYCKNFGKCHYVIGPSTTIIFKKVLKSP
jgi:hypothetical protein